MTYLLLASLVALAWTIWFILQIGLAMPVVATLALGAFGAVVFFVRSRRERRAAQALSAGILAEGAREQALSPERRARLEALRAEMRASVAALRTADVTGKRRGAAALYALPWYAIIGPPGAGKTTALRHSGLSFPHHDSAVRGVGGTRNCDFWFTQEAVLLDTAGRYATLHDDRQEWLEFLDLLRKHRGARPLDGLIVAVALPDVVGASDAELDAMGHKIRARLDEVTTRLGMSLPVYLFVTKCDLAAGFVELFGDLKRQDRARAWGATLPLDADRSDPGALFARELDVLVERLHQRAVRRLHDERDRRVRESIFRFPLEIDAAKGRLRRLVERLFDENAYRQQSLFRGFYLMSGTQEALPLAGALAGARGPGAPPPRPRPEPRGYFLHDVFTKVVFPDAELASRSPAELRRQRATRLAIAATAVALALTLVLPSVRSYQHNRALVADTERLAKVAAALDWESSQPISGKLEALAPVLAALQQLDAFGQRPPLSHRFGMYTGDRVAEPLRAVYVAQLEAGFVRPVMRGLETELNDSGGERYHRAKDTLKLYLMLADGEHLDLDWATERLTHRWAGELTPASDLGRAALRRALRPHVAYYLGLVGAGREAPSRAVGADAEVVAAARAWLARVPLAERLESLFVSSLEDALYDPVEGPTRHNLQFPPLSLADLFADQPDVLTVFRSRQQQKTGRPYAVPGPFTDKGHLVVLANIEEAKKLLAADAWVVPLDEEEKGARLLTHLDRLAADYEAGYVRHWRAWLADIEVTPPTSLTEAVALLRALRGDAESPYLRILRALEDHTQWTRGLDAILENDKAARLVNREVNARLSRRLRGLRVGVDVREIRGRVSTVPPAFADLVAFGVPTTGDLADAPLHQHLSRLDMLRAMGETRLAQDPGARLEGLARELKQARDTTEAQLSSRDAITQGVLRSLLLDPLSIGEG